MNPFSELKNFKLVPCEVFPRLLHIYNISNSPVIDNEVLPRLLLNLLLWLCGCSHTSVAAGPKTRILCEAMFEAIKR